MKAPLFAVLALASAAAVAQTPTDGQLAEPRPSAMSAGPNVPAAGAISFEGTVISSTDNQLIVRLADGRQQTLLVNHDTVGRRTFRVGDRVSGTYSAVAGRGDVISKVEWIGGPATTQAAEATGTTAAEAAEGNVPPATTPNAYDTAATTTDAGNADESATLPATASPAPLVGLIGLLAAAGAGALRRFRK